MILDRFPPFTNYLHQVIQYGCWEDGGTGEDGTTLRVQFKDEFGADTEI